MTQHVLTQSGNMLVLTTPTKATSTVAVPQEQYHTPKRPKSIREQIMANSDKEDTKERAKNHKIHVPPPVDRTNKNKKPVPSPSKVASKLPAPKPAPKQAQEAPKTVMKKPAATAKAVEEKAPQAKKETPKKYNSAKATKDQGKKEPVLHIDAKKPNHKAGLLHEKQVLSEAKASLSLASFYAGEDKEESEAHRWHFAAHFTPDAPLSAVRVPEQRKVVALVDRQVHTSASRWQATMAETQREVQEARQDNSIAISDQFGGLESKDEAIQKEVQREDRAAVADAAAETPVFDPRYHSDQVHFSKAFSVLEQQDRAVDQYMNKAGDDADLSKIRTFQDESMNRISAELKHVDEHPEEGHLPPLPVGRAFLETPFHDQWATLEKSDGQAIKDIKRDPNLRAFIQRGVSSHHY